MVELVFEKKQAQGRADAHAEQKHIPFHIHKTHECADNIHKPQQLFKKSHKLMNEQKHRLVHSHKRRKPKKKEKNKNQSSRTIHAAL